MQFLAKMHCKAIVLLLQICLSYCLLHHAQIYDDSLLRNDDLATVNDDFAKTTLRAGFMNSENNVSAAYKKMKTIKGKEIHSFLGIQYGQDPSKNRFKTADIYSLPGNTLNATTYGKKCPQMTESSQFDTDSSENCLTLNVYTNVAPDVTTTGTIPVMVFSQGDLFHGDTSLYKPDVLLDYDIVLVTIQYRLGALGFFSMNSTEAPGNAGLADHILALNWVQQNIGYLGGNKDKVTIVGQDQGALLFGSLLFYKNIPGVSQPLFHAAILQSGSALGRLAIDGNPEDSGLKIAEANYCADDNVRDLAHIMKCMREKAVQELTTNVALFHRKEREAGRPGVIGAVPTLQTGMPASVKLVYDTPENIAKDSSKLVAVPVMTGVNKNEGSYYFGGIYWSLLKGKYDDSNYLRSEMLADILKMSGIPEPTKDLAEAIRNDYVGDGDMAVLSESSKGLIDLTGSLFIKTAVWRTAQLMASVNSSFFYAFDFDSKDSLFDTYFQTSKPQPPFEHGVTHGDELMYLFNLKNDLDEKQNRTRDRIVTLWTNFIIYHDPTPDENKQSWYDLGIPKWQPLGDEKNYLLIEEECQIETDYMKRRHITRIPKPLPTQEEYDFVTSQRQSFMICMIVFLLTTLALGVVTIYNVIKAN